MCVRNLTKPLCRWSCWHCWCACGSWSLWPFRRLVSKSVSDKKDSNVHTVPEIYGEKRNCWSDKNHTRALTPMSEQLASLNLAQGQNTVTFTFSTSVLGAQKVICSFSHLLLWCICVCVCVCVCLYVYGLCVMLCSLLDMHSSQVDAIIYLWSWDTRIVISDVDGTITKWDLFVTYTRCM